MPATFEIVLADGRPADLRREGRVLRSVLGRNHDLTVSRGPDEPIHPGDRGGTR